MGDLEKKELELAWKEDSERADDYLARYYAGSKADQEIAQLSREQTERLGELYCGPLNEPDTTAWLLKAEKLGNPHAKAILDEILPGRFQPGVQTAQEPSVTVSEASLKEPETKIPPVLPETVKKEAADSGKKTEPEQKKPVKKAGKKKSGALAWVLGILIIAMLCAGGWFLYHQWESGRTVTIDASQYVEFLVSGENTRGTASASIDAPAMTKDSGRLINNEVIGLLISKNKGLSNGDTVTVEVTVNEENAKNIHVEFTNTVIEYTVSGLTEPDLAKVDVFQEIEVTFTGENGKGTASVVSVSDDPFLRSVRYVCEPAENLSNGDVIMVTAVVDEEAVKKYEKMPEFTEKEATVVSLFRYPSGKNELTDPAYGALYDKGTESLKKTLSDPEKYSTAVGSAGEKLQNMEVLDTWVSAIYFVIPNPDSGSAPFHNRVITVYHVKTNDSGQKGREFLYPVVFEDVLVSDDGVVSCRDLSEELRTWNMAGNPLTEIYHELISGYMTDAFFVNGDVLE